MITTEISTKKEVWPFNTPKAAPVFSVYLSSKTLLIKETEARSLSLEVAKNLHTRSNAMQITNKNISFKYKNFF